MKKFCLTRRRDVLFTLEECPSYGGKQVKTKQVKKFHGEGCQSTFFTKTRTVLQSSMRACFKNMFLHFSSEATKVYLTFRASLGSLRKKVEKTIVFAILWFLLGFRAKKKKKDLKVKVFFKFLKAQNANCFCFVFYLWRYNKTIKDNLLIKWTMIPTSVFCFFRFLKPWHLCLLGKMVHPENNSKG